MIPTCSNVCTDTVLYFCTCCMLWISIPVLHDILLNTLIIYHIILYYIINHHITTCTTCQSRGHMYNISITWIIIYSIYIFITCIYIFKYVQSSLYSIYHTVVCMIIVTCMIIRIVPWVCHVDLTYPKQSQSYSDPNMCWLSNYWWSILIYRHPQKTRSYLNTLYNSRCPQ